MASVRMRRWVAVAAVLAGCVGAAACDEKLSSIAGPSPTLEPTFASISREIFSNRDAAGRTACTSCHNSAGAATAGRLDLSPDAAYAALVNVPSVTNRGTVRVAPGDPDNSLLVRKLEGAPGLAGARMPLNGPPYLTPGQILIIRRWIAQGALNN